MKNKGSLLFLLYSGLLTAAAIAWFLSGKLVGFPAGTKEGGFTGAVGVALVLMVSFMLIAALKFSTKKRTGKI